MIYVQEWENRECIKHISNVLTKWHQNCAKTSRKFWNNGNICTAKRNSDGMYHRAKIQRVYAKRRECLVNQNFFQVKLNIKIQTKLKNSINLKLDFKFRFNGLTLDTPKWCISKGFPHILNSLTFQFK